MPGKIRAAVQAKTEATTESNHRYAQVAAAISLGNMTDGVECRVFIITSPGRLIRNGAVVLAAGSTGVTLAQSLGIVGTSLDTAGYSAARAILVTSMEAVSM